MLRYISLLICTMVISSCAHSPKEQRRLSSHFMSCKPDEIEVKDRDTNNKLGSWEAQCKDNIYYCDAAALGASCRKVN